MLQRSIKLHRCTIFAVIFFVFSTHLALAQCGEIKILSASVDQSDINQGTITLVFENETDLEELSFHIFLSYSSYDSDDTWPENTWSTSAPSNLLTAGEHVWEITEHQGLVDFSNDYLSIAAATLVGNCNSSLPVYSQVFPIGASAITNGSVLDICRPYSNEHSGYLDLGVFYSFNDTIYIDEPGQVVNDLEVYLNMGHSYVGDLSISLKSPEGTTVELLAWPNGHAATANISGYFKDSHSPMGTAGINKFQDLPNGQSYLKGPFKPDFPFSAFDGEQLSGPWVLSIVDNLSSDDGFVFDWCLNPNMEYEACDEVASGYFYLDENGNSIYDETDELLAYELIGYSGNSILFSDANGQYSICDPDSGAYIFNLTAPPYSTPLVDTLDITYTSDSLANVSQHYGYSIIENASDLSACGNSTGFPPPRPGFWSSFSAYYAHNGTACAYDVVLTATLTGPIQGGIATTNPNAVISGQTITLEFDSLCPGDWGSLEFDFTVPDTVSIGFQYGLDVSITSSNPDFNPNDNTCFSQATVVASYDPNDKQVNRTTITPQEVADEIALTYTIRFQNTGNFYAERVVLVDTLPDFLDPLSFQFLETSDPMEISLEDQVLKFTFNDINLPTEADDPEGSIGYVSFSMRVKPNMLLGDSVANQTGIYFDFNAPIITNFAVTTVDEAVSVNDITPNAIRVYPNPAGENVYFESSHVITGTVQLLDLSGRTIQAVTTTGETRLEINISQLEAGIYLIGSKELGWERVVVQ